MEMCKRWRAVVKTRVWWDAGGLAVLSTAVGPTPGSRARADNSGGAEGALCLTIFARGTHHLTAGFFGTLRGRSHAAPDSRRTLIHGDAGQRSVQPY